MQLDEVLKDGLVFTNDQTGEQVIFNYYTFYNIVRGILMHYAGFTESAARELLNSSFIITKPPVSYKDVAYFTHEYEYHWAMILAHGNAYWLKEKPVNTELPNDYDEWEAEYIEQNQLAASSYEYL